MPQIRKQPKRRTKKIKIPSFKNPFLTTLPFLPQSISRNLQNMERIVLRNLDDIITSPKDSPSSIINTMKEALTKQQIKINMLKHVQVQKNIKTTNQVIENKMQEFQENKYDQKLECPVQINNVGWILQQNGQFDFFD